MVEKERVSEREREREKKGRKVGTDTVTRQQRVFGALSRYTQPFRDAAHVLRSWNRSQLSVPVLFTRTSRIPGTSDPRRSTTKRTRRSIGTLMAEFGHRPLDALSENCIRRYVKQSRESQLPNSALSFDYTPRTSRSEKERSLARFVSRSTPPLVSFRHYRRDAR